MASEGTDSRSGAPARRGVGPESLFERLLAAVFGTDDPERLRKRKLRQIAKSLNKSRYKFYKPRSREALPGLARFLYDIYRVVGPAQALLQGAHESSVLRNICVERAFTDRQRELLPLLGEDHLREKARNKDIQKLAPEVRKVLVRFMGEFDANRVKSINLVYNQTQMFLALVRYDFYFTLRKFDSSLAENNYTGNPKFDSINADYVTDDIKDFLEVFLALDKNLDYDGIFAVLNEYRGMEVVSRPAWNKLVSSIDQVQKSNVLADIVRHAESDPDYQPVVATSSEHIVEPYVEKIKRTAEAALQRLRTERRNGRIDKLAQYVFGTSAIARTKHYTEQANLAFSKRMVGGYTLTAPINYLKAFLVDYFKRDVREMQELLIIRGKWASNVLSHQISEAFHKTMEISEQLVTFDDSLSEEAELGMKIKRAMGKVVDKDPKSTKALRQELEKVNETAQTMINESAQNLITIGKSIKTILEDYEKEHHDLILNWKELEGASEQPIKDRLVDMYKKIYYFIQLMQMFTKEKKTAS